MDRKGIESVPSGYSVDICEIPSRVKVEKEE